MRKIGRATIHNMDCMDFMKGCKDNQFDLAIVDPPYGIGCVNQKKSRDFHGGKIKWNDNAPTKEYFDELYRISKNQIIWGCNYYTKHIKDVGRIVHDKTNGGKTKIFKELSDVDLASHSFGVNMKLFIYGWAGNMQGQKMNTKNIGLDARIHPTQKPVALYEWLLSNYAKEGDSILDTHLGSGSIAISTNKHGFDLTACELDEDYFKAACERIRNAHNQPDMFTPEETKPEQVELL